MSDEEGEYSIYVSLGDLEQTVSGPDKEWVEEQFEESWQNRLDEAGEMKRAIRDSDRSTQ